jgi:hypothetical protein
VSQRTEAWWALFTRNFSLLLRNRLDQQLPVVHSHVTHSTEKNEIFVGRYFFLERAVVDNQLLTAVAAYPTLCVVPAPDTLALPMGKHAWIVFFGDATAIMRLCSSCAHTGAVGLAGQAFTATNFNVNSACLTLTDWVTSAGPGAELSPTPFRKPARLFLFKLFTTT